MIKYNNNWQSLFNITIRQIMELLEITNNDALKKAVKGKLFDLSDKLKENELINYNREEEYNETNYNRK